MGGKNLNPPRPWTLLRLIRLNIVWITKGHEGDFSQFFVLLVLLFFFSPSCFVVLFYWRVCILDAYIILYYITAVHGTRAAESRRPSTAAVRELSVFRRRRRRSRDALASYTARTHTHNNNNSTCDGGGVSRDETRLNPVEHDRYINPL